MINRTAIGKKKKMIVIVKNPQRGSLFSDAGIQISPMYEQVLRARRAVTQGLPDAYAHNSKTVA